MEGDRKQKSSQASTPAKYCSTRCRSARHNTPIELRIEKAFISLLNGESPSTLSDQSTENTESTRSTTDTKVLTKLHTPPYKGGPAPKNAKKKKKGEARILVLCSEVEGLIFGGKNDPEKCFGRRKNRKKRGTEEGEWRSVDMVSDDEDQKGKNKGSSQRKRGGSLGKEEDSSQSEDDDGGVPIDMTGMTLDPEIMVRLSIRSGTRIRPSQGVSQVNGGIGGEKGAKERIEETDEMLAKRREGQRRAEGRELVRCVARRGVAFGFLTGVGEERRLCEAVMQGNVVESSFAKGEWGVRWRE